MKKKNARIFSLTVSVFFALFIIGSLLSVGGGTVHAATSSTTHPSTPNIVRSSCANTNNFGIYYNSGRSEACFAGDGYTGVNPGIHNITTIHTGIYCGWYLMYSSLYSGGDYETFSTGGFIDWSGFPNTLVTQVDIQGQNCDGYHA